MGWCGLEHVRASSGGCYSEASMTSRGWKLAGCLAQVLNPGRNILRDIEPQNSEAIHNRRKGLDGLVNPLASPALRSNGCATRVKLWMKVVETTGIPLFRAASGQRNLAL